ncbi:MAG: hypothetical protein LQ340_004992 [Diploschistes diacapsis]|nr:MAG: hypothetical protein LQ340_004992 [Diploschistes diacapsis]
MADRRQHSIRRQLFSSSLSRRGPTANPATTSSAAPRTHIDTPLDGSVDTSSSDILVRNANGEYAVTIPGLPPATADAGGASGSAAGSEEETAELEVEKRLAELLDNRTRQSTEQELVDAVRASLQRKVDALAEDNWIFEGDSKKT